MGFLFYVIMALVWVALPLYLLGLAAVSLSVAYGGTTGQRAIWVRRWPGRGGLKATWARSDTPTGPYGVKL